MKDQMEAERRQEEAELNRRLQQENFKKKSADAKKKPPKYPEPSRNSQVIKVAKTVQLEPQKELVRISKDEIYTPLDSERAMKAKML
jgi:hypothetical protein